MSISIGCTELGADTVDGRAWIDTHAPDADVLAADVDASAIGVECGRAGSGALTGIVRRTKEMPVVASGIGTSSTTRQASSIALIWMHSEVGSKRARSTPSHVDYALYRNYECAANQSIVSHGTSRKRTK